MKGGVTLRRIATVISVVAIMVAVMMVAIGPVAAQSGSSGEIAQAEQKKGKGKQKQQKKKATPDTGGISTGNMALVGLGASMVVGGAVLVRRRSR
jgi:LPXTG-motif cell wall-anchored protein